VSQYTLENTWEYQAVVYLIWKIATPTRVNVSAALFGIIGSNLWGRIGQGKNNWVLVHLFYPLLF